MADTLRDVPEFFEVLHLFRPAGLTIRLTVLHSDAVPESVCSPVFPAGRVQVDLGESILSRTESLCESPCPAFKVHASEPKIFCLPTIRAATFRELGPPDLCHVIKTTGRSGGRDVSGGSSPVARCAHKCFLQDRILPLHIGCRRLILGLPGSLHQLTNIFDRRDSRLVHRQREE